MFTPLFILLFATILTGLFLFVRGALGRRINDHPICRLCSFDLVGLYPGVVACPECGGSLGIARAIQHGERRAARGYLLSGSALLLVGLLMSVGIVVLVVSGSRIQKYKPTFLLMIEGRYGDQSRSAAAAQELQDRDNMHGLDDATIDGVLQTALTVQQSTRLRWEPAWGTLVESLFERGSIDAAGFAQYLEGGCALDVITRDRVACSDSLSVLVQDNAQRFAPRSSWKVTLRMTGAKVDGQNATLLPHDAAIQTDSPTSRDITLESGNFSRSTWNYDEIMAICRSAQELSPGAHTLEVDFTITGVQGASARLNEVASLVVGRTITARREFVAVAGSQEIVRLIAPDSVSTELMAAALIPVGVSVQPVYAPATSDFLYAVGLTFNRANHQPYAFDVVVMCGPREYKLTPITSGTFMGLNRAMLSSDQHAVGGTIEAHSGEPVRLFLRPNAELARLTLDLNEIYGGEIEIPFDLMRGHRLYSSPSDAPAAENSPP